MRCLERIATFYLPKYLIATYIVEITSGWRVIETIASFFTIFYRTPCKTQIKKSHNIFHANNSVILTQKMSDQCFQELSTSGKLAIHKIATNLVKIDTNPCAPKRSHQFSSNIDGLVIVITCVVFILERERLHSKINI